jgi:hypothetical protein
MPAEREETAEPAVEAESEKIEVTLQDLAVPARRLARQVHTAMQHTRAGTGPTGQGINLDRSTMSTLLTATLTGTTIFNLTSLLITIPTQQVEEQHLKAPGSTSEDSLAVALAH